MKKATQPFERTIDEIYTLLVDGIRRFFSSAKTEKALLGLSGGLDSAVVAALAVDALGAENVRGLLMPSDYSTVHSVTDAVQLADKLGIQYDIVEIKHIFKDCLRSLAPLFKEREEDVTEENLQARIRGLLLMAVSNKFGNLVLNTSNKSELAVGYGTLYGDLCGALSVLGDVYKTQVYQLADYMNRDGERIPQNTIMKAPSAELRPDHKDTDSLPDYDILDKLLFRLVEQDEDANLLVATGADREVVDHIVSLRRAGKFKYLQIPPIIRVSSAPLLPENKLV